MAEMTAIRMILYVAQIGWMSSFSQNTTLRERIPAYLQQLCPGSGVCLNNIIDPEDDMPSCCAECSCSEDCKIEGNCCFQSQNKSTIDHTRPLATKENSACLYPMAKGKDVAFTYNKHRSYFMISSSPNNAVINEMTNNTVTCGDIKVAPWGSMFPVYSKSTGKIYKNMVCADAHNVTDGDLWDFYVSCHEYGTFGFISSFQRGLIPGTCTVNFFYEGGMSLLKSEQCYNIAFYGCVYNTFNVPAFLTVTGEEIVAACESGLVSPYKDVYANIFCYICNTNSEDLLEDDRGYCTDDGIEDELARKGNGGNIPFTMIFDANAFSKTFIEDPIETDRIENTRVACTEDSENQIGDRCRTISCPIGQMFNHEDGCIYSGEKWFTDYMLIKISVYAEGTINISNLLRSKENLKSPWPNTWKWISIAYEDSGVPLQTSLIFIFQYIQLNRPFNPKSFFAMVNKYISKPWILVSNNETIKLQANITKFTSDKKQQKLYFNSHLRPRGSIMITKLFFCQQVALLPHEYSINSSLDLLFNKITNTTLLDGEYTVVENEQGVGPVVCLEDSGLYRATLSNANIIISCGIVFQCLAILFTKLIF